MLRNRKVGIEMAGRKIAVYCRISTDSEQQQNSLSNQMLLFQPKIENDGDELYKIFYDEGLTGTKLNNRKGFNDMLFLSGIDVVETLDKKVLPNGNFDSRVKRKITSYVISDRKPCFTRIYIKNTSRFARNTLSYEIVLKLREKGVSIYFLEQDIDTSNYSTDFLFQLFQVLDQQDSRDKSTKTSTGIRKSAERGVIRTNSLIFGYKYVKATNSLVVIDNEAETVKRIFELYSQGLGTRRIIKVLDSEGRYTRSGKSFGVTSIRRILINEKYYGGSAVLKWNTGRVFEKNSYPLLKDNYDVLMSDRIEPIITKELFDKCQSLMKSKVKDGSSIYVGTSLFAGKIKCGCCGSSYMSDKDKRADGSSYEFYRCHGKKIKGNSFCSNSNVSKEQLEIKFHSDIKERRLERIFELGIKSIEQQIQHLRVIYNRDNDSEMLKLETELLEHKNAVKVAFKEFASGRLLESLYSSIIDESNAEIMRLEERLTLLREPERSYNERLDILLTRKEFFIKKLKMGLDENDYLEYLIITVSRSGIPYFQYIVPEFDIEVDSLFKIIGEKHQLGNVF